MVGKLTEILRTSFDGDFLDAFTTFERIESIEHARKTIPMDLDAFQGNCHRWGKYGHTAKECRSSKHGRAEKPQRAQCGKKHHGQCWTRSYTSSRKDSQKGGWKGDRKGNGKGTKKGGKIKGGKGGNHGNGKRTGKKGQRLNDQKNSGQVDLGNSGLNNLGAQKLTLRVGVTMIGTLQIRILRLQQQQKNFSMRLSVICDSRIWVMSNTSNLFKDDRLDPSQRTITFGIDTNCTNHPATRGLGPQRFTTGMCVQHCRPRQSV